MYHTVAAVVGILMHHPALSLFIVLYFLVIVISHVIEITIINWLNTFVIGCFIPVPRYGASELLFHRHINHRVLSQVRKEAADCGVGIAVMAPGSDVKCLTTRSNLRKASSFLAGRQDAMQDGKVRARITQKAL